MASDIAMNDRAVERHDAQLAEEQQCGRDRAVSTTFRAHYPGRCVECDDDIEVDDLLRYDEDGHVVHASHTDGAQPEWIRRRKPEAICPTCHLTLPCDCEVA